MRVAVLSDIHANWQALEAVLEDLPTDLDELVCLGDVVGYGADPERCVDEISERSHITLLGNHDVACVRPELLEWFNDEAAFAIRWTRERLGDGRLRWLEELPAETEFNGAVLVHASPRDPVFEYILDGLTARKNLELLGDRVGLHGHTHVPGIFRLDGDRLVHAYDEGNETLAGPCLVNPGSVGQPRDGNPDASYGIWDVDESTFEFRRVGYDRETAKRRIAEAGLPERFAQRLDLGR